MTWLSTQYIWMLIITAPGGLVSQQGIYATEAECVSAMATVQVPQQFAVECRQRVRSTYQ
jgi:hypothetical protein